MSVGQSYKESQKQKPRRKSIPYILGESGYKIKLLQQAPAARTPPRKFFSSSFLIEKRCHKFCFLFADGQCPVWFTGMFFVFLIQSISFDSKKEEKRGVTLKGMNTRSGHPRMAQWFCHYATSSH
jgi:hypothetical protein